MFINCYNDYMRLKTFLGFLSPKKGRNLAIFWQIWLNFGLGYSVPINRTRPKSYDRNKHPKHLFNPENSRISHENCLISALFLG